MTRGTAAGLLVAALAAAAALQGRAAARALRVAWAPATPALLAPRAEALGLLSLGYREALADLLLARAAVVASARYGDPTLAAVDPLLDAVLALDPRRREAYALATNLVFGSAALSPAVVRRGADVLGRGVAALPADEELRQAQIDLLELHLMPQLEPSSRPAIAREVAALRADAATHGVALSR